MRVTKSTVKLIAAAVLVVLVVVIVLRNRQPVETDLLVLKVTMSRALLLFVTLATGFVVGLITAGVWRLRKKEE